MKREIIVLNDVEMGVGGITDDFISDKALSKLILSLAKRRHGVDIVFNGDTFEFLKAPVIIDGADYHPRHISEELSLNKLNNSFKAHKKVFDALKIFLKSENNGVYFVIGNHDLDLFFPGVQKRIKTRLGNSKNIDFGIKYQYKTVHAEHGHEYDIFNMLGLRKPFTYYFGEKILNLSWVSIGVIHLAEMKKRHPFIERIRPLPALFSHYKLIREKLKRESIWFALKTIFTYPFCWFDPTRRIPFDIVKALIQSFNTANYDTKFAIERFIRMVKKQKTHVHVLGHMHLNKIKQKKNFVVIQCDSWRDEYLLNKKTGSVTVKKKKYVQIIVDDNNTTWEVLTWPIKRNVLKFDDIIKDEHKYIGLVKAEES